jgi:peroxiredoxin
MVTCERCHRKFPTYSAVLQHYKTKHSNVTDLSHIKRNAIAENETQSIVKADLRHHGGSRTKLAIFLIIVIIAVSVSAYVALNPQVSTAPKISVGSAAPDFTLQDMAGGTFTLSQFRDKSNVLLFFNEGLSCQPCLQQMYDLDGLNAQFVSNNVMVVSITSDSASQLRGWVTGAGPRYGKVLSDPNLEAFNLYHPAGTGGSMMTHTFVLINKAGMVVWRQDFGPGNMYVQNEQILAAVTQALGT